MPRNFIPFRTALLFILTLLAAAAALNLAGCSQEPSEDKSEEACIADSLPALQRTSSIPSCDSADWQCRARCGVGSPESCLGIAYALQEDPAREAEAVPFFKKACLLGEANACTNYAANLWVNHANAKPNCSLRTFEKACSVGEPFACGMVGRIMLEDTASPEYAKARKHLEDSCDKVGGFPCRVLAKHLESGKLGGYEPGRIQSLLARACAGGDPDACGNPATASETFH